MQTRVALQPDAYRRPLSSVCADEGERPAGGHKTLGRQAHGAHAAQHAASQAHQSVIGAPGEGCCAASDAHSLADSGVAQSAASLSSASGQSLAERLSVSSVATLLSGSSVVASELGSDGERAASLAMRDKYTMEHFDLIKVLGKGSFGKVLFCTFSFLVPRSLPRVTLEGRARVHVRRATCEGRDAPSSAHDAKRTQIE